VAIILNNVALSLRVATIVINIIVNFMYFAIMLTKTVLHSIN